MISDKLDELEKSQLGRRPGESRGPSKGLDPGFQREPWIPAFAGMTNFGDFRLVT
jgi:hypothetical protein